MRNKRKWNTKKNNREIKVYLTYVLRQHVLIIIKDAFEHFPFEKKLKKI